MKTLITPVGTSLFTNYLNKNSNRTFRHAYETIRRSPAEEWDEYDYEIKDLKTSSLEFIKKEKESASAELQSIVKIQDKLKEDLEIRLFASDTIASRLAAEILADDTAASVLGDKIRVKFNTETDVIKGLQIENPRAFSQDGMSNLVQKINSISNNAGGYQALAINITGGFKATLPYLTILAQLYRVPIYYTFEDTDALITIPQAPLVIDWGLIERYSDVLWKINEGIENWSAFRNQHYQAVQDLEAFIEVVDEIAFLSPIGQIFWDHYQRYFVVELPRGSYFKYDFRERGLIDQAIEELYGRLDAVLRPDFLDPAKCYKRIRQLGNNNDLNHGGQISNPMSSPDREIFIFKSTNAEHIRLLYTFKVREQEIARITICDLHYKNFNHQKYITDWNSKFGRENFPEIDFVTRTFEIPPRILTRRNQNV